MEKKHNIAQLYAYSVCLVAIIAFIISLTSFAGAMFDLDDPLHSSVYRIGPSLASFENYKLDVLQSLQQDEQDSWSAFGLDDETLRTMYKNARADKIKAVRHRSHRTMRVHGVILALCAALFAFHWRWMSRLVREGVLSA